MLRTLRSLTKRLTSYAVSTLGGADGIAIGQISFPVRLAKDVEVRIIESGTGGQQCPGTHTDPQAGPGFLCLYPRFEDNVGALTAFGLDGLDATSIGAVVHLSAGAQGFTRAAGSWAVTAH